jgi:hypothetical protein
MKTPTKNQDFCIIFYFVFDRFSKMDHFDISFACSIFSKSWESQTTVFWVWPTSQLANPEAQQVCNRSFLRGGAGGG